MGNNTSQATLAPAKFLIADESTGFIVKPPTMAPETPKTASSRLLNMKFMQRAAANSAASTPGSDSDAHSAKKRKHGHMSKNDAIDFKIDQASIQAAVDEREAKRQAALAQHGGNDTQWVLDTSLAQPSQESAALPRKIVYVGYGDVDTSDDEDQDTALAGRTSTYKKRANASKKGESQSNDQDTDDDEEEGEEDGEDEDDDGSNRRGRAQRDGSHGKRARSKSSARPSAEAAKAKELRDKRRKKEVNINKLTSISSGGGVGGGAGSKSAMTCYKCQKTGHKAVDCSQSQSKGSKGSSKRG